MDIDYRKLPHFGVSCKNGPNTEQPEKYSLLSHFSPNMVKYQSPPYLLAEDSRKSGILGGIQAQEFPRVPWGRDLLHMMRP